ncbi:MAG TPA: hypothetical protein VGC73_03235, partial [Pyrinomonadaceae bacterium]
MFLILFFVFLAGLFLTYTLFLFTSRASDKKRAILKERLADAIRSSAHSTDIDVQLAREELMSEIPWMNRVLIKLQVSSKLKQMIDQADSHITVMRLILFSLTAGVLAFLAVSMVSASYLLMGFFAVVATALPFLHIQRKRKK